MNASYDVNELNEYIITANDLIIGVIVDEQFGARIALKDVETR